MVRPMTAQAPPTRRGLLLRFSENRIGYLAVLAALAIGVYTIYTLAQFDPAQSDGNLLSALIAIDVLAVIIVGGFVIRQILRLWTERRQKMAGYQLHWRLALLFGGVAALPAVITTVPAFSTPFPVGSTPHMLPSFEAREHARHGR